MRKLASIQLINSLTPIEGKDRIEYAGVLGWHVIVNKKDNFSIGSKCVYVEIDSQLPQRPEFEFLASKKYRIRTMKMAGVLSEGICFPISILPPGKYEVGDDVTEILGITKYEPMEDEKWWLDLKPAEKAPKKWYEKCFMTKYKWWRKLFNIQKKASRSAFPSFISKTDETRIQNCPAYLEDKENKYVLTEKVDGTSGTFALVREKHRFRKDTFDYIVCSRNMRLQKDNSIYWDVSDKFNIEMALHNLIGNRDWVAIQGECIGPKVQGNKYKVTENTMYVFNLVFPEGRRGSVEAKGLLETRGFNFVPIVDKEFTLPDTVDEMLAVAHGDSVVGPTLREGLVIRSQDGKTSFKAVDPEFLLHYNL